MRARGAIGRAEGYPPSEARAQLGRAARAACIDRCDSPGDPLVTGSPASSVALPGAHVARDLCRFRVGEPGALAARHRHGLVRREDAEWITFRVGAMGKPTDLRNRSLLGRHLPAQLAHAVGCGLDVVDVEIDDQPALLVLRRISPGGRIAADLRHRVLHRPLHVAELPPEQ